MVAEAPGPSGLGPKEKIVTDVSGLPPAAPGVCWVCDDPILPHQPDVILLGPEAAREFREFHHYPCALVAYKMVERAPHAWHLMHRFPGPRANGNER